MDTYLYEITCGMCSCDNCNGCNYQSIRDFKKSSSRKKKYINFEFKKADEEAEICEFSEDDEMEECS